MASLLSAVVTPAFVSAIVSLWANRIFEGQRARRDHLTKLFEVAREDVRRGAEVAIDYFSTVPSDRTALQEAKVLSADRELRTAISPLVTPAEHLSHPAISDANAAFIELIAVLTGGNFQSKVGSVDKTHLQSLIYGCSGMRSALAALRDDQLRALVEDDWVMVRWRRIRAYLLANNPFRDNP